MSEKLVFQFVANTRRFVSKVTGSFKRIGGSFKSLQAGIAALGLGLGFREITRSIANFEDSVARLGGISQATTRELKQLQDQAIELAKASRFSASENINAAEELARAGLNAAQIYATLPGVINLAAAANINLAQSAELSLSTIRQFQEEVTEAGRVADVLAEAAASSGTDVTQLGEALRNAGKISQVVGLSLEETVGLLGILGNNSVRGARAGTQLRSLFSGLSTDSEKASQVLAKYNLNLEKINVQNNGLAVVLERLAPLARNFNDAVALVGTEAVNAFTILANSGAEVEKLTGKLKEAAGTSEELAERFEDNLAGAIRKFKSAIDALVQSSGRAGLGKLLRDLVELGTLSLGALDDAAAGINQFGQRLAVLASEQEKGLGSLARVFEILSTEVDVAGDAIESLSEISANAESGVTNLDTAASDFIKSVAGLETAGELAGDSLQLVGLVASDLRAKFAEAGKDIPSDLQLVFSALDKIQDKTEELAGTVPEVTNAFGDLSKEATAVLTEIEDEQKSLDTQTRALAEAYSFLSDSQNLTAASTARLSERVLDQIDEYENLGIAAPASLERIAVSLGVAEGKSVTAVTGLKGVAEAYGEAATAFEAELPTEGLDSARDSIAAVREQLDKLARIEELGMGFLSVDELNEFNRLVDETPPKLRKAGETLRDEIESSSTFGGGLTIPVDFEAGGDGLLALAASDLLGGAEELTRAQAGELGALGDALLKSKTEAEGLTAAEEELGAAQSFTNEQIADGNRGFEELQRSGAGAAEEMKGLGVEFREAGEQTEEAANRIDKSRAILSRLKDRLDASREGAERYADAARDGAGATEDQAEATDGLADSLKDQTDAAERAGKAGKESAEKPIDPLERQKQAVEELNQALEMGTVEGYKAAQAASEEFHRTTQENSEKTIQKCLELQACLNGINP